MKTPASWSPERKTPRCNTLVCGLVLALLLSVPMVALALIFPQQDRPVFRVEVNFVQLAVAVTGPKGDYVGGLKARNFRVYEDGIEQKISSFEEVGTSRRTGSSVFVLLDTSNIMYPGIVYAQDAITDFLRGLDLRDSVAVYSFSRNLLRACPLTTDRSAALTRVHQVVAGDQTSLYNALLLTLNDAVRVPGRKTIVVFSNGPDNGSTTSPRIVAELAQNSGIPIYIVSTQEAGGDRFTAGAFQQIAGQTGGKTYFASTWRKQIEALNDVHDDLAHVYVMGYYPAPNKNMGWRKLTVEVAGQEAGNLRVRTRSGYQPESHPKNMQVAGTSTGDSNTFSSGDK